MKRRFHRKNKKFSRTEGGSLLYVIFFVTLLSILSCGYMAASKYHIRAALKNRACMEARLTARMIHNSFCEAVRMGESEALGLLMDEFENDSSDLEADEENDDIDEENGIDEESVIDKENDIDEESVIDKENDIDEELEDKEYMTVGEGSYTDENGDSCTVCIRLKAYPVRGTAFVDTWTKTGGFSMHLESEVPLGDAENIP